MSRKTVGFGDRADHAAGDSCGKAACWYISRYDRTGSDYRAFADGYTAADGHIRGNPAVIPDCNRSGILQIGDVSGFFIIKGIPVLIAKGMDRRQQRNIRTDKHRIPDCNLPFIQHREVEVCIAVFADDRIGTEIKINRLLQIPIIFFVCIALNYY